MSLLYGQITCYYKTELFGYSFAFACQIAKFSIARIPWLALLAPFKNSCARLLLFPKCLNCVRFCTDCKWQVFAVSIYIARIRAQCALKFVFWLVKNNVFILERSKAMTCQILRYLEHFRVEQCSMFLQHKCSHHRPFTCFYWHFKNQRRRRPALDSDGEFTYSPFTYCSEYDETTGVCPNEDK